MPDSDSAEVLPTPANGAESEPDDAEEQTERPQTGGQPQQASRDDDTPDSVREYLRAIGQHALPTRSQELQLGLAVERRIRIEDIRKRFLDEWGRQPTNGELAELIFRELDSHRDLLVALGSALPA